MLDRGERVVGTAVELAPNQVAERGVAACQRMDGGVQACRRWTRLLVRSRNGGCDGQVMIGKHTTKRRDICTCVCVCIQLNGEVRSTRTVLQHGLMTM